VATQEGLSSMKLVWLVDTLLGNDLKVSSYTMAITRQWPVNSNRGTVFSVWFVLRCYKQDKPASQSVELVKSWLVSA
jgi:hypothetical protein